MTIRNILLMLLIIPGLGLFAQENVTYQKPSQEILELADVELAPSVFMDDSKEWMVLAYRDQYKTIEELSKSELRLGGLRIDPSTNIGSRTTYFNNVRIKKMNDKKGDIMEVKGLPDNPRLSNISWSPDQKKIALTNTTNSGLEVWVLDIASQTVKKITNAAAHDNLGDVINWFEDSEHLLVKMVAKSRKPLINVIEAVPTGPTVSVNEGATAQNRTYQDLLSNKNDEHNFEQLALSELYKVDLDGNADKWLPEAKMYDNISFSPDGNWVMVSILKKPFSYLVTYSRFPTETAIYSKDGNKIETILEEPLLEDLPKGRMSTQAGRRNLSWRSDKPATLVFVKALDGGDQAVDVPFRDEVFTLEPPFNGEPKSIMKTVNRFRGVQWGNDNFAIAYDFWWNTRNVKTYVFNPSKPQSKATVLFDRNYQDVYSDPGSFVSKRNDWGSYVLSLDGTKAYLIGDGYSDEGQFPFVDEMDLKSKSKKRLYQSSYTDKLENIYEYDVEENSILVRIEASNEYPNYYFRNLKRNKLEQITAFENPFKSIEDVQKEVITYKRADGLELSGTLYLPMGYDKNSGEKLPMILWAYPREYKDKNSASQNTQNPNEFTYLSWSSPVFWVTKGYAVLDDAAFPIIGEGDDEPNDTFRKQLVGNAAAAIDAVDDLGYIDPNRVAVGGHSYGAFMVANLLSHSNLFAAGIARSGAYNRTLTPFGFQSEERSYWEAPEVYYTMSPFMHADKMKTPLLLVHGEADNNSGTYPMQSERYFNALKGLGATARLVMFPKESHGYRAKETILHLLWEQDQWLEKYVKNREKPMMEETIEQK